MRVLTTKTSSPGSSRTTTNPVPHPYSRGRSIKRRPRSPSFPRVCDFSSRVGPVERAFVYQPIFVEDLTSQSTKRSPPSTTDFWLWLKKPRRSEAAVGLRFIRQLGGQRKLQRLRRIRVVGPGHKFKFVCIVVDYTAHRGQCYLVLPFPDLRGNRLRLTDTMGDEVYDREGSDVRTTGSILIKQLGKSTCLKTKQLTAELRDAADPWYVPRA